MELEDLRALWEGQNDKLDAIVRLNSRALQKAKLEKADTALGWLYRWILVEVIGNIGGIVLLGWFIASNFTQLRFVIPGAVLDACLIAVNVALIGQMTAIRDIDYGAPVVTIQRKVELLRIRRIETMKWTFAFCPLVWVPLLIVSFEGLFGVDVYAAFGDSYLLANLLFGIAVIPVAVWISKRYAGRVSRSPFLERAMRVIAGSELSEAADSLNEVMRFAGPAPEN
jgi:hypothetical protein